MELFQCLLEFVFIWKDQQSGSSFTCTKGPTHSQEAFSLIRDKSGLLFRDC